MSNISCAHAHIVFPQINCGVYLFQKPYLALFHCRLNMVYFSSPFPVHWCVINLLHSQATPTIMIKCSVYSRVAFISIKHDFVRHLLEGDVYFMVAYAPHVHVLIMGVVCMRVEETNAFEK